MSGNKGSKGKNYSMVPRSVSGSDTGARSGTGGLKFSLYALVLVTALKTVTHLITNLQQNAAPEAFPLPLDDAVDIFSLEWNLGFIGFVTLISAYSFAPRSSSDDITLEHAPLVGISSIVVVLLIYLLWPWFGTIWSGANLFTRVMLTNAIGLGVLGYCVFKAQQVRQARND